VRQRVGEAGLAYELVASRADLTEIVVSARSKRDEPDVRTLRGWRRDLVGDELLELLAGRRTVRATRGGVSVEPA
jgi:ribonuclease D